MDIAPGRVLDDLVGADRTVKPRDRRLHRLFHCGESVSEGLRVTWCRVVAGNVDRSRRHIGQQSVPPFHDRGDAGHPRAAERVEDEFPRSREGRNEGTDGLGRHLRMVAVSPIHQRGLTNIESFGQLPAVSRGPCSFGKGDGTGRRRVGDGLRLSVMPNRRDRLGRLGLEGTSNIMR